MSTDVGVKIKKMYRNKLKCQRNRLRNLEVSCLLYLSRDYFNFCWIFIMKKQRLLFIVTRSPRIELNLDQISSCIRLWRAKIYRKSFCTWLISDECNFVSANGPHCVKYFNFTWFHGVEICGKEKFRDSPQTLQKLCLSTDFPHHEIRWNYGILRSARFR